MVRHLAKTDEAKVIIGRRNLLISAVLSLFAWPKQVTHKARPIRIDGDLVFAVRVPADVEAFGKNTSGLTVHGRQIELRIVTKGRDINAAWDGLKKETTVRVCELRRNDAWEVLRRNHKGVWTRIGHYNPRVIDENERFQANGNFCGQTLQAWDKHSAEYAV